MNEQTIYKILSVVTEKSEEALMAFSKDQSLLDLGLDSIKFIQFIVAVEEAFQIEIRDSDLLFSKFETIEKLFSTLSGYLESTPLKKVLVCDCDNVLWRGVAGEETISLDSDTLSLQQEIVNLCNRGVLVCLCSKNDRANFEQAFENPDMVLKNEHIAIAKINFRDKAANLKEIAAELNVSLNSFVFLDDSDYELGLISALLPEVCVVKADYHDLSFIKAVSGLFSQSASSMNRTALYKEQKEREKEKLHFKTVDEYNNSLETKAVFCPADSDSAGRIAELSQRTNQFNLSGRRYAEQEVSDLLAQKKYHIRTLSVSDKYGDMGLVGAVIYEDKADCIVLHSFYLSCRAFGRGFETLMINEMKAMGKPLFGVYNETDKNRKHKSFYNDNGVGLYEL